MNNQLILGIYEKAFPSEYSWERKLLTAKSLGFDFVEMSIDESDEKLERLNWDKKTRKSFAALVSDTETAVPSICLSAHRRFPLGSRDPEVRKRGLELLLQAIDFAVDTGIRTIQLAGYDVYYEPSDEDTVFWFYQGLARGLAYAAVRQVTLSMEIMDYEFMNSVVKFLNMKNRLNSPWFALYPDVGNLSAWNHDVLSELELGIGYVTCIHLKDTIAVGPDSPGTFKGVPFGAGCVNFTAVFRKLAELHYSGPFLIEMWSSASQDPVAEIRKAKAWMLDRMAEAGFLNQHHDSTKSRHII